jgi:L-serine dehydratase
MNESFVNASAPTILNDVLGPVMRGPSSSHTAASYRIGLMLRDLAGGSPVKAMFEFHPTGSLATTHYTQGSDMGLAAGLSGMDMLDAEMPRSVEIARNSGIDIDFRITDYQAEHPNTYKCTIEDSFGQVYSAMAESVGGGMFRFTSLLGHPVFLQGDEYVVTGVDKNQSFICKTFIDQASAQDYILTDCSSFPLVRLLKPVMPVLANRSDHLPFKDLNQLISDTRLMSKSLGELGLEYEVSRSGWSIENVNHQMIMLVRIWRESIRAGLNGTEYKDRLIGSQSPLFMKRLNEGKLIPAGPLNRMIAYSTALMEVKSSMGVIIAAPTAGSCGGLPGCLIGLADEHSISEDLLVRGFWAAGLVGLFIAQGATFAAEVAGCQAETGAGASMAAAGLVEMAGGSAQQALDAASVALQNIIGLVCDPVANRVEIPCLGRNAAAAGNALTSANLILGGADPVIPLAESIQTMMEVGKTMPSALRCTALGGLAATPTAKLLESRISC